MRKIPEGMIKLVRPAKIPSSYFVAWLKEKTQEEIQIDLHHKYFRDAEDFHRGKNRYLSSFIGMDDVKSWNARTPVLISAQTGAGKNTFIKEVLLKNIIRNTPRAERKNLVLILSNRIALGRQSKMDFARFLAEHADKPQYIEEIKRFLQPEGIDHLLIDFDIITVSSYHQLWEKKLLDSREYKYIVCDECHFFTSDARFNSDTNEILRYIISKGEASTRIYMTATIEVVIEAILREEHARAKQMYDGVLEYEEKMKSGDPEYRIHVHNAACNGQLATYNQVVSECIKEETTKYIPLHVHLYHMERNFDYISTVTSYTSVEDLSQKITSSSNEKWLVFVSTRKQGEELVELLKEITPNLSCAFVSAKNRSIMDAPERKIFNYIVENEDFRENVLISTSVLDNGINIKCKEVKNIAIDIFDRAEFLQMLGRIRIENGATLNLYIKRYNIEELTSRTNAELVELAKRLQLDYLPAEYKKKVFDPHLHRYSEDAEIFAEYNPCAIYQLVDTINRKMYMIRKENPEFCVSPSENEASLCRRVYHHYSFQEGTVKPWDRNIVDMLESPSDMQDRDSLIEEDRVHGIFENRYAYTFDQTFESYFLGEVLPSHFKKMVAYAIMRKKENLMNALSPNLRSNFIHFLNHEKKSREVDSFEELTLLIDYAKKHGCDITVDISDIELWQNKMLFYQSLADDKTVKSPLDMQLRWIGKTDHRLLAGDALAMNDLNSYIKQHAVSKDDLEKEKSGTYYKKDFLEMHGIPIDTKKPTREEKIFSERYFGGKPLRELLGNTVHIDGVDYTLSSCNATGTGHTTYYLFVGKKMHLGDTETAETGVHAD